MGREYNVAHGTARSRSKQELYLTLVKIACFQASGGRCGWKPHLPGTYVATWRSLLQKTQLLTARSIDAKLTEIRTEIERTLGISKIYRGDSLNL